jgi:hypothetical protein
MNSKLSAWRLRLHGSPEPSIDGLANHGRSMSAIGIDRQLTSRSLSFRIADYP